MIHGPCTVLNSLWENFCETTLGLISLSADCILFYQIFYDRCRYMRVCHVCLCILYIYNALSLNALLDVPYLYLVSLMGLLLSILYVV